MEVFTSMPTGALSLLGLGLVIGLKHALEVDHVVAVSSIVSEHRSLLRAALVGGLWGAGHTLSLVVVSLSALIFRVAIPTSMANLLEFAVALMIIALGTMAVWRVVRKRGYVHMHQHSHDGSSHVHIHFHEQVTEHGVSHQAVHSHAISRLGFKPLLVGAIHGLAGSSALTLLVLMQIHSVSLGLLYLGVFGVGSTMGMLLMSSLIGVPFALSGRRLPKLNYGLQTVAGGLSIVFGFWYAYQLRIT